MAAAHNDLTDIESRNKLRVEAGLPLLDIPAELARLRAAREEAEFEEFFAKNRHRFSHDRSLGFLSNLGIYNAFRKTLRKEMEEGRAGCQ
jgi:hypothetical protein